MEPRTWFWIGLAVLASSVGGGCGGPTLPGFANPPPIDASLGDGEDDDAAASEDGE
jgi:hypothetical protein